MNIINKLNNLGGSSSLKYYGKNDIASRWQIKNLVDYKNEILNYFNNYTYYLDSYDKYVDYIFVDSYSKLNEMIGMLRNDLKDEVTESILLLNEYKKNYKVSKINEYIKDNYEYILDIERVVENTEEDIIKYEVFEYTMEYITNNFDFFSNKINIYKYIMDNYGYRIIYHFKDYNNVLSKYPELYEILLSKKNIETNVITNMDSLYEVFKVIRKNKNIYNKSINIIIEYIERNFFNTDETKIISTYNIIMKFTNFLKKLHDEHFKEFQLELKNQEEILNIYLQKNGKHRVFEVNIKEYIDLYNNSKYNIESKCLSITHIRKNGKIISNIQNIIKEKTEKNIIDWVSTNRLTNEYFTYSVQNNISIVLIYGKLIIQYMISEENRLIDLVEYMNYGVTSFLNKYNIEIDNISTDFEKLKISVKDIIKLKNSDDIILKEYLYHNTISFEIKLIEKILREISSEMFFTEKYIPYSKLDLDTTLKDENIRKIIGIDNCKIIEYYLLNCDFIGKNIRNDIMHYNNSSDICNLNNVLLCLYFLVLICNELLICSKEKNNNGGGLDCGNY